MAITLLGDLVPYENQFRRGYIDRLQELANIFNGGSANCIRFQDSDLAGTLSKTAFFKDFGTVERRDITSTSDQTPDKIERDERHDFRTYFKFRPVQWQVEAFNTADKMGRDAIMYMIGQQMAEKKLRESLNQAITICAAAIESKGAATVLDLTSPEQNFLQPEINKARAKWGDSFNQLKIMVMHSAVFFPLVQNQTMNFQYDLGGGITLYGGTPATMGLPFIVTDQPGLTYTSEGTTYYKTLLLTDGAVTVGDAGNMEALLTPVGLKENIAYAYQAEWSMWNNVRGYQLKSTAQPQNNPSDAVLADPDNWEAWTSNYRNTAGVLVKSIADLNAVQQVLNVRVTS